MDAANPKSFGECEGRNSGLGQTPLSGNQLLNRTGVFVNNVFFCPSTCGDYNGPYGSSYGVLSWTDYAANFNVFPYYPTVLKRGDTRNGDKVIMIIDNCFVPIGF